jgi:hypothetical protein
MTRTDQGCIGPGPRPSVRPGVPHTFPVASLDKLPSNHSVLANGAPPWALHLVSTYDSRRPSSKHATRCVQGFRRSIGHGPLMPACMCRHLDELVVSDRLSQNSTSRFSRGTEEGSPAPLPVRAIRPELPRAAYIQHEEADTGQTNRQTALASVEGSARQRSLCVPSSGAGSRQTPALPSLLLAVQAQADHRTA